MRMFLRNRSNIELTEIFELHLAQRVGRYKRCQSNSAIRISDTYVLEYDK